MAIYSSGSVAAQKLLMRHTEDTGDLTACVSGWFDPVNAGPKGEATSYEAIAGAMGVEVRDIVFFSDSVAGMSHVLSSFSHALSTLPLSPAGLSTSITTPTQLRPLPCSS